MFKTPRTNVDAMFISDAYKRGPSSIVSLRLFCDILQDDLNEFAYDATVAGLNYEVRFAEELTVSIGGFSDTISELLEAVAERMGNLLSEIEEADEESREYWTEKFEVQRELLLQTYQNFYKDEPCEICSYFAGNMLIAGSSHIEEYISALAAPASLQSMCSNLREAFKTSRLEVLVHGNTSKEEALGYAGMFQEVAEAWSDGPRPTDQRRQVSVYALPKRSTTVLELDLSVWNPDQESSAVQNVYQVGVFGEDERRDACLLVLGQLADSSVYQQLRTEEQLGYVVSAEFWLLYPVCGLTVIVQGNRLPPAEVDQRIEEWLVSFRQEIESMTEEEFVSHAQGVIANISQKWQQLAQETAQRWVEIERGAYRFDRLQRQVAALATLSKADALHVFDNYLVTEAAERRKLSIRAVGARAAESERCTGALQNLADVRCFTQSLEVFS